MSQLFGLLSPGLLLRSLFSGAFFVIAFFVARGGPDVFSRSEPIGDLATVLLVSLFAGVVAYALHRSVIYALIEWLINSSAMRRRRVQLPLISRETIQVLLHQWDRSSKEGEVEIERARHFSTWADYAHLQYTSALCILFGALCGRLGVQDNGEIYLPLVIVALAFAVAAFVADWRLHSIREYVERLAQAESN